jgi:hypothetical protein
MRGLDACPILMAGLIIAVGKKIVPRELYSS